MVSDTIKAIHEVEQEADRIVAEGKTSASELIEQTKKNSMLQSERELLRVQKEAEERIHLAEADAKARRDESLESLKSELETLKENAKMREKDAIQRIIDEVVS
ncbi:MAG: hypothetical protein SPI74_07630 [Eubacterium sp.]|nr:hypothetical protein [Eubacterium sp.]